MSLTNVAMPQINDIFAEIFSGIVDIFAPHLRQVSCIALKFSTSQQGNQNQR